MKKVSKQKKAKLRKAAAVRMARVREWKDRRKICRVCHRPTAMSKHTGRRAKMCKQHLRRDTKRKLEGSASHPKTSARRLRRASPAVARAVGPAIVRRPDLATDRVRLVRHDGELVYPLYWR